MTAFDWLGTWEPIEAPGKHTKLYPSESANGYQYMSFQFDRRPKAPDILQEMSERVIRAIPVEGNVQGSGVTWDKSPQVKFWLDRPRKTISQRILERLRRPI